VTEPFFEGEDDDEPSPSILGSLGFGIGAVAALTLGLCLVAFLAYTGWQRYSPFNAPGAYQQARWAKADSIWGSVPTSMAELSHSTSLGEARWRPGDDTSTTVRRTYSSALPAPSALDAWWAAAVEAGWRSGSRQCREKQVVAAFTKSDGRWPAVLTVTTNVDGQFVSVSIDLPPRRSSPASSSASSGCP
jgi:hypothetical protein